MSYVLKIKKMLIDKKFEEADVSVMVAMLECINDDLAFLDALYAAGVDNWVGYSDAQEMME